MAPALVQRFEHKKTRRGWGNVIGLDCIAMPTPYGDSAALCIHFRRHDKWRFGWTSDSLRTWVSRRDRYKLSRRGFHMVTYLVPPGKFVIGDEQIIFDYQDATLVEERGIPRK